MAFLSDSGFRGISLREACDHRDSTGAWPENVVVLTFDDGYESLCRFAMPPLARRGFSATVFLVTRHVGGKNDWAPPPPGLGLRPLMGWSQVAELTQAGWELGSHTCTHPDLRKLTEEEVDREIKESRKDIEDHLNHAVDSFAYPFGYVSVIARTVAASEFRAACTAELRCATWERLHSLPRVDMYYIRDLVALERLLAGRLEGYLTLRRWGRALRSAMSA